MKKSFKPLSFLFIIIFSFFILAKSTSKISLRQLWNEDIEYDDSNRSDEEQDSIAHCRNSDYKYFIHYVTGEKYTFSKLSLINQDNAVRIILKI